MRAERFASHTGICCEIINQAAQGVGGLAGLAQLLRQDPHDIEAWAQGSRLAPPGIYIKALDLLRSAQQAKIPNSFG